MRNTGRNLETERGPRKEHVRLAAIYVIFVKGCIFGPYFLVAVFLVFQSARLAIDDFEHAHYNFMKILFVLYTVIAIGAYITYSNTESYFWFFVMVVNWGLLIVLAFSGKNRAGQGRLPGI